MIYLNLFNQDEQIALNNLKDLFCWTTQQLDYLRDACWVKCYSLLEQYQSGLIERPTVEQVLTELPNLEW
jgi:hypothetical protein